MPCDYKTYHPKWRLISWLIKFKRAKGRCEVCDIENYSIRKETGTKVVLTVSHLDHDKKNNKFWNLKAMCQKCHLNYDKDYHKANRKANQRKKSKQYEIVFKTNAKQHPHPFF